MRVFHGSFFRQLKRGVLHRNSHAECRTVIEFIPKTTEVRLIYSRDNFTMKLSPRVCFKTESFNRCSELSVSAIELRGRSHYVWPLAVKQLGLMMSQRWQKDAEFDTTPFEYRTVDYISLAKPPNMRFRVMRRTSLQLDIPLGLILRYIKLMISRESTLI